jgi:hypothetical protein
MSQIFNIARNSFGQLVLTDPGQGHEGVVPVRAFPIAAPGRGHRPGQHRRPGSGLDRAPFRPARRQRQLIADEMASREFMPVIQRIENVSSFATPSTWDVETDRGRTSMVLKGEEDIRRLGKPRP